MFGNGYQSPQYQPVWQQTQMYQPAGPRASIIFLHGEEIARQYPVAPGSAVYIMDTEDPVLYVKTADSLTVFDLTERKDAGSEGASGQTESQYVTKDELNEGLTKMKDEIVSALKGDVTNESGV